MSEFPEWVERQIGWTRMSDKDAQRIHAEIREGFWVDPRDRNRDRVIWWRWYWPFDRRQRRREQ